MQHRPLAVDFAMLFIFGALIANTNSLPWWFWIALSLGIIQMVVLSPQHDKRHWILLSTAAICAMTGYSKTRLIIDNANHIKHMLEKDEVSPVHIRASLMYVNKFGVLTTRVTQARNKSSIHNEWMNVSGIARVKPIGFKSKWSSNEHLEIYGRGRVVEGWRQAELRIDVFNIDHIKVIKNWGFIPQSILEIKNKVRNAFENTQFFHPNNRSLIKAITLGIRDENWNKISLPFRNTGTAHLLAVSGLHLSILVATTLIIFRVLCVPTQWQMIFAVIVVFAMLFTAEIRIPLARAGFMVILGFIWASARWRIPPLSLLCVAIVGFLLNDPSVVLHPGFQLSFSVVAALILILSVQHTEDPLLISSTTHQTLRVTWVAWLIASPIALYHFGNFSPIGIPGTIILLPLMSPLLVFGYLYILAYKIPILNTIVATLLEWSSDALWITVLLLDKFPLTPVVTQKQNLVWVVFVEVAALLMLTMSKRCHRRFALMALVILWIWPVFGSFLL